MTTALEAMGRASIEDLLRQSLLNLSQSEDMDRLLSKFISYLHSEMFFTLSDLRLAVDDKDSWSDLRLPVRLKLEMKRLLQSNFGLNPQTSVSGQVKWKRCFSEEYDSHYFLNLQTNKVR